MKRALQIALLIAAAVGTISGCSGSSGDFECRGSACVCPSSGDCNVNCLGDCNLQCAGSGACGFTCGAGCVSACTGSGPCGVEVGAGSMISCTGSGGCDVICHGNCTIRCPGSGECAGACAPDSPGCVIEIQQCNGQVNQCAAGAKVCGGNC
jgi:hypothetical protein